MKAPSVSSEDDSDDDVISKSSYRAVSKQKPPSPSVSSESYSESVDSMSDSESESSTENNEQVGGGWSCSVVITVPVDAERCLSIKSNDTFAACRHFKTQPRCDTQTYSVAILTALHGLLHFIPCLLIHLFRTFL